MAQFWAKSIRDGDFIPASAISTQVAERMLNLDLVEFGVLKERGIVW